nr:formin-like protein 5 [Lolium perenne]
MEAPPLPLAVQPWASLRAPLLPPTDRPLRSTRISPPPAAPEHPPVAPRRDLVVRCSLAHICEPAPPYSSPARRSLAPSCEAAPPHSSSARRSRCIPSPPPCRFLAPPPILVAATTLLLLRRTAATPPPCCLLLRHASLPRRRAPPGPCRPAKTTRTSSPLPPVTTTRTSPAPTAGDDHARLRVVHTELRPALRSPLPQAPPGPCSRR